MLSDEKILKNFAANIAALRGDRSLRSFADEVGLSPIHLSRIEQGKTTPNVAIAARLAYVIGVPLDTLLKSPRRCQELVKSQEPAAST